MSEALIVFAAQYVYILLMGLQSLNVRDGRYLGAIVTSILLGSLGFSITSIIGAAKGMELSLLWFCFVLSAPAGIVTAMAIHPTLGKFFSRRVACNG